MSSQIPESENESSECGGMKRPDRPPDLDLESMNVWQERAVGEVPSQEELAKRGVFWYSSEEPMIEIRYYKSLLVPSMLLLLMSRRGKDGRIIVAIKMKGQYRIVFGYLKGSFSDEQYFQQVKDHELVWKNVGFELTDIVTGDMMNAAADKISHPG